MGRFSWDAEEALNITEILTGLGFDDSVAQIAFTAFLTCCINRRIRGRAEWRHGDENEGDVDLFVRLFFILILVWRGALELCVRAVLMHRTCRNRVGFSLPLPCCWIKRSRILVIFIRRKSSEENNPYIIRVQQSGIRVG